VFWKRDILPGVRDSCRAVVDCLTSLQYFDKLATKLKARGRLHVPRVFLFLSSNGRDKVKLSPHIVDKTEWADGHSSPVTTPSTCDYTAIWKCRSVSCL